MLNIVYGNYVDEEYSEAIDSAFYSDQLNGEILRSEYEETQTILTDNCSQHGITTTCFDTYENLLWIGNQLGYVTSYYSADMQKYTMFRVHTTEEIRSLLTTDSSLLVLTPTTLRCQMRRGLPLFTHNSENLNEMQCITQLARSQDTILMGGHQDKLIEFNLNLYKEVNIINVGENGCAILRQNANRTVCCGDPTGMIKLRDPRNISKVIYSVEAHTGSLSDFDVHDNLLVSCGFSNTHGSMNLDQFLVVHDLRMMRSVSSISMIIEPFLLRFMESYSSRIAVVSAVGQCQIVDTVALSEQDINLYQMSGVEEGAMALSMDVSPSSQAIVIGDNVSTLHLFTTTSSRFNTLARDTIFAQELEPPPCGPIRVTDELAVYSTIPLPLCDGPLASDLPAKFRTNIYRKTPPIDSEILATMKMKGTVGYAPNPNNRKRNQVVYYNSKFENISKNNNYSNNQGEGEEPDSSIFIAIPRRYRKIELKFKSEDFDYEQYNKTGFSGLESNVPNSYCNAMLQVLYYLDPLRKILMSHICQEEFCLSCELSFLFYMMHMSKGIPCHSGNFLRALRNAHDASALGLILPDHNNSELKNKINISILIQNWNRFILHQIHLELLRFYKSQNSKKFVFKDTDFPSIGGQQVSKKKLKDKEEDDNDTDITKLFGCNQLHKNKCLKCNHEFSKQSNLMVCNLVYPELNDGQSMSFCDLLQQSICPKQTTMTWCEHCESFQQTLQTRSLKSLPSILTVNCAIESKKNKDFWQQQMDILVKQAVAKANDAKNVLSTPTSFNKPCRYGSNCTRHSCRFMHPGQVTAETNNSVSLSQLYYTHTWLPLHIKVDLQLNGELVMSKYDEDQPNKQEIDCSKIYDLYAVVCYINEDRKNLVSIINVGQSYHEHISASNPASQWYIFNDISVSRVVEQEAIWFSLDWKIPCILYWVSRNNKFNNIKICNPVITSKVFTENVYLNSSLKNSNVITFEEIPKPGELVAIDAEFVTLNQEESELRSDGKLTTIKPVQMAVARISCIRGEGPYEGKPFIDDYISTQEQIVDYLTQFSGINPGDLDIGQSSKNLTTLKATYMKLRYLVDNGIKFVGHGLHNDFRMINLIVPPDQIIDTVALFRLPNQRNVSLRFLAWYFLGNKIQSKTHDSVEDAHATLQLYKCFKTLEEDGILKDKLEELYKCGKEINWMVPGE
ncbi:PAN2-PAN3 deadenylation complex catalytic subunit PAN2 isoform X2 [Daktulosphaira vitifoliae]|uniref:PAN2-PAN3 deadenylation complex catalytic subunit PAN2 isoform X2 n=1 Tax=Daktulosphaira vitifoliae TaxID=58002 RepID=UPI0021A9D973|nr:PAN2-PAN3 deadenylation complex catalytic subunit PAN2 isoform X2 [Daktulosphaira vitifoliae]